VSVSRDRGDSWVRHKLSDTLRGWCRVLAVAPSATRTVYAAGHVEGAGVVYRSGDLGDSWVRTATAPAAAVRSLAVHPQYPGVIYAAAGDLFRSTDAGETWIRFDLPVGSVDMCAVRLFPGRPDTVVAAGGNGVVMSTDGGATWSRLGDGLDCADVAWLEFCEGGARLVAATSGRSCYSWTFDVGIAGPPVPGDLPSASVWPNPCTGLAGLRLSPPEPATVAVCDVTGRVLRRLGTVGRRPVTTLDLRSLPDGVYYLCRPDPGPAVRLQKVVVRR